MSNMRSTDYGVEFTVLEVTLVILVSILMCVIVGTM